jgi:hypothetical protein
VCVNLWDETFRRKKNLIGYNFLLETLVQSQSFTYKLESKFFHFFNLIQEFPYFFKNENFHQ